MPINIAESGIPAGAVLISVVAITFPFFFLIIALLGIVFFKHRRNRMTHETIRAMIEKGVPIPPELIVPPERSVKRRAWSDFRTGMVILALGLGIRIFFGKVGWIAVFVGIAFLIVWLVERKSNPNSDENMVK